MRNLKYALVAAAALGGVAFAPGNASAMPNGLPSAANALTSGVQDVRWVCGPYRCWWRPGYNPYYGAYGYYGPRYWRPGLGWGYRVHRWHHW
jgi:hypothetical protein